MNLARCTTTETQCFLLFTSSTVSSDPPKKCLIQISSTVMWSANGWRGHLQESLLKRLCILVQEKRSDLNPAVLSFAGVLSPTPGQRRNVLWQPGHCDWTQFCWGQRQPKPEPERGTKRRKGEVLCCLLLCTVCRPSSQPGLSQTHTKAALTRAETGSEGVAEERKKRL